MVQSMRDGDSKAEGSRTHGEATGQSPFSLATIGSVAIGAILVIASLAGFVAWHLSRIESTLERIQRVGTIRVGYAPEAPYAFRDHDRVTGESPEIARVAFAAIGVPRIEWVQVEFRSLIPSLLAGHFDMIASGLFITPERSQRIAFSQPTFLAHTALLVKGSDAQRPYALGSFRDPSFGRLAVLAGSYEWDVARRLGIDGDRLLEVPDLITGVESLRSNQTSALALSRLTLRTFISHEKDESLAVVYPLADSLEFEAAAPSGGFGFRIEDVELRLAIDGVLADLVGTPEHLSLVERFGVEANDLPRSPRLSPSTGTTTESKP